MSDQETTALTTGVAAAEARAVCVVIHGRYGAPEVMLDQLVNRLTTPGIHYVLPRAAGNSWYDARSFAPLTRITRDQVAAAVEQIGRDLAAAVEAGAPGDRVVVGGFSQGACMTLEYAMARGPWSGAACGLTGHRVGSIGDDRATSDLTGLPVYLSNGARDPFITLPEFAETVREVAAAGARLRVDLFPRDAHVMSPPEIAAFDAVLDAVAGGVAPLQGPAA